MSNFPAVMRANDLAAALAESKIRETSGDGGVNFMRFNFESGEYTVGRENEDVTGKEALINTQSIKHGWILWSGGKPTKRMVPFTEDLPIAMDPIADDNPQEGRSVSGAFIEDGEMFQFDTSSYGGRKGVDFLLSQIKTKAVTGSEFLYPRVRLDSESYETTKGRKRPIHNPVFTITAWCDINGNAEDGTAAPAVEDKTDEVEDKPVRQRRRIED